MKPHTLLKWSIAILLINFALPFLHLAWRFMPTDHAFQVAVVYAVVCAWLQIYAFRKARAHQLEYVELQTAGMRKLLKRSLLGMVLFQLFSGWIGFMMGGAHLYTLAAGTRTEVTRVVWYSEWKGKTRRSGSCYKHQLEGSSVIENKFGSPCLDVGYGTGTRFHFRGKSSSLGLHVDEMTVEPKGKTRTRSKH